MTIHTPYSIHYYTSCMLCIHDEMTLQHDARTLRMQTKSAFGSKTQHNTTQHNTTPCNWAGLSPNRTLLFALLRRRTLNHSARSSVLLPMASVYLSIYHTPSLLIITSSSMAIITNQAAIAGAQHPSLPTDTTPHSQSPCRSTAPAQQSGHSPPG